MVLLHFRARPYKGNQKLVFQIDSLFWKIFWKATILCSDKWLKDFKMVSFSEYVGIMSQLYYYFCNFYICYKFVQTQNPIIY